MCLTFLGVFGDMRARVSLGRFGVIKEKIRMVKKNLNKQFVEC